MEGTKIKKPIEIHSIFLLRNISLMVRMIRRIAVKTVACLSSMASAIRKLAYKMLVGRATSSWWETPRLGNTIRARRGIARRRHGTSTAAMSRGARNKIGRDC